MPSPAAIPGVVGRHNGTGRRRVGSQTVSGPPRPRSRTRYHPAPKPSRLHLVMRGLFTSATEPVGALSSSGRCTTWLAQTAGAGFLGRGFLLVIALGSQASRLSLTPVGLIDRAGAPSTHCFLFLFPRFGCNFFHQRDVVRFVNFSVTFCFPLVFASAGTVRVCGFQLSLRERRRGGLTDAAGEAPPRWTGKATRCRESPGWGVIFCSFFC